MQETLRHRKSFDYFYSLGNKRSLQRVADKFTVSRQSVTKWSKTFNWQERVQQRDIENARRIEKKTDDVIVNTKADYRKDIKRALLIIKAAINTAIGKDGKLVMNVSNIDDLKKSIDSFDKLVRADLLLMGEDPNNIIADNLCDFLKIWRTQQKK